MFMVVVSILATIFESHHYFRVVHHPTQSTWVQAPNPDDYKPKCQGCCGCAVNDTLTMADYPATEAHPYIDVIDDICLVCVTTSSSAL